MPQIYLGVIVVARAVLLLGTQLAPPSMVLGLHAMASFGPAFIAMTWEYS